MSQYDVHAADRVEPGECRKTGEGGRNKHRVSVENTIPHHCMTLCLPLITSLKSNLCTALTIQKPKQSNCVISHARNTTPFPFIVSTTGTQQLLVTNKGQSSFPGAKPLPRSPVNSTVSSCT
jgi:hypothetical protein